jgi:hypothetical protein
MTSRARRIGHPDTRDGLKTKLKRLRGSTVLIRTLVCFLHTVISEMASNNVSIRNNVEPSALQLRLQQSSKASTQPTTKFRQHQPWEADDRTSSGATKLNDFSDFVDA